MPNCEIMSCNSCSLTQPQQAPRVPDQADGDENENQFWLLTAVLKNHIITTTKYETNYNNILRWFNSFLKLHRFKAVR